MDLNDIDTGQPGFIEDALYGCVVALSWAAAAVVALAPLALVVFMVFLLIRLVL
jgi:hypothetical protein